MLKRITKLNKNLKNFSNKIERQFLNDSINEKTIEKINKIEELFEEEKFLDYTKINYQSSEIENYDYLKKFLEKNGIAYFLYLNCASPIKLENFLSNLSKELLKVDFSDFYNDKIIYNNKIIEIKNLPEIDCLGKYLDKDIMINEQLILNNKENKLNIVIHELIHLILFNTGLQNELNSLFKKNERIDELLCELISKNWKEIFKRAEYEHPNKRIEDFNIIKKFLNEKNIKNPKLLELGAGNAIFTILCLNNNWNCEGIDINIHTDAFKHGLVKYQDIKKYKLENKYDLIHNNVFMYLTKEEIYSFFEKNINSFNSMYITYNTTVKNNKMDMKRISFLTENDFIEISKKFNLEYIEIEKNKKRILFKKEAKNNDT